jgi:hypothetical protein
MQEGECEVGGVNLRLPIYGIIETGATMINKISIILILLIIISPISSSQSVYSKASFGIAHYTLPDWSDFWSGITNEKYSKNNPNMSYLFSLGYQLNERHSLALEVEYLQAYPFMSNPTLSWEFKAIPISIVYELRFGALSQNIIPYIGAGVSYVISEVTAISYILPVFYDGRELIEATNKRDGKGYGIHSNLGILTNISNSIFLDSHFRFRFSDGMAFTDEEGYIKVEFTGYHFNFGIGYRF